MELVDTYDESLNVTDVIDREIAHRTGILHKTVHCWFVDLNFLYFQIRGKSQGFPELLDVTVGGHISHAEKTESALKREVWEELGVDRPIQELTFMGQNRFVYRTESLFVRKSSPDVPIEQLVVITFEPFQENGTKIRVVHRRGPSKHSDIAFNEWAKSLVRLMKVIGDPWV